MQPDSIQKIRVLNITSMLLLILFSTTLSAYLPKKERKDRSLQQQASVKERLHYPFGTILKIDVEIVDGDELHLKGRGGKYLFKIVRIEDSILNDPLLIPFEDETGLFPTNDFELYEHLNGKTTGSISSDEAAKMKQHYAGKRFRIAAYESGKFTGLPDGYNEYLDERTDKNFHFENYLIVIGKLY